VKRKKAGGSAAWAILFFSKMEHYKVRIKVPYLLTYYYYYLLYFTNLENLLARAKT